MDSFKNYLREVMAGPGMGDINLSKSQKRVLKKVDAVTAGGEPPEAETGELPPEGGDELAPEEQQEELGGDVAAAPPEEPQADASGNLAAQAIVNSEDSRNLVSAVKSLARYGYIETQPSELGPDDEPYSITLTDKGNQAIEAHGIRQDQNLLTPEEQQQSAPQAPPPSDQMGMGGGAPPPPAGGMGGEMGGPEGELGGEEGELGGEEDDLGGEEGIEGETGDEELGGEDLGGEELPTEEPESEEEGNLKGKGISIELSSFFQNVHDLSKFIKS